MRVLVLFFVILVSALHNADCQSHASRTITLTDVINNFAFKSPSAEIEKLNYYNDILEFENYKKSYLPSISFDMNLFNFNRSLKLMQNTDNGSYNYIQDNSGNSNIGTTIRQKVGFTGGDITVTSSLYYLNEFSNNRQSFSTTPFSIGYSQNFRGGGKLNKYERSIAFKKNAQSIKTFCIKLSAIQGQTLDLYMNALLGKLESELLSKNQVAMDSLLNITKVKVEQGGVTEYDYKQIELQCSNNKFSYENAQKNYHESLRKLFLFLGMMINANDDITIENPLFVLPLKLDHEFVISTVYKNNPFMLNLEVKRLEADMDYYSMKVNKQFNGTITLNYGLNQYADQFKDAYTHPNSRQSVTLGLQIPIFQWGINRNTIRIAKNNYDAKIIDLDKKEKDFASEIESAINTYYKNINLWFIAEKSYKLSQEQYELMVNKIVYGNASVYELVSTQQEQASAMRNYYSAIRDIWKSYFELQSLTLYDFIAGKDLTDMFVNIVLKDDPILRQQQTKN